MRGAPRKLSLDRQRHLAAMYADPGLTVEQIAARLGIAKTSVTRYADRLGLTRRMPGNHKSHWARFATEAANAARLHRWRTDRRQREREAELEQVRRADAAVVAEARVPAGVLFRCPMCSGRSREAEGHSTCHMRYFQMAP